jgi:hypothetical protein
MEGSHDGSNVRKYSEFNESDCNALGLITSDITTTKALF